MAEEDPGEAARLLDHTEEHAHPLRGSPPPFTPVTACDTHTSPPPLPAEKPPAYDGMMWTNEQPIGSGFLAEMGVSATPPIHSGAPPTIASPHTNSMLSTALPTTNIHMQGPRRVTVARGPNGFGITLGGTRPPCYIHSIDTDSPANAGGVPTLFPYDRVLEVNGVDVTCASLETVSALIRSTPAHLHMVVVPGHTEHSGETSTGESVSGLGNLWAAATFSTREDTDVGNNASRPVNHIGLAMTSLLCCPLIGLVAVYHALQVSRSWGRRQLTAARAHSIMARRLASTAIFYGGLAIMLYLFMQAEKERVKAAGTSTTPRP